MQSTDEIGCWQYKLLLTGIGFNFNKLYLWAPAVEAGVSSIGYISKKDSCFKS
jgi:hypothetical protein